MPDRYFGEKKKKKKKQQPWSVAVGSRALKWSGIPRWLSAKESACQAGAMGWSPGQEDPLEKKMAIHSSILS